jgi:multisubunit Na+/H+ antiporter MnhB subunit
MIRNVVDALACLGLFALLAAAIVALPTETAGLTAAARDRLADSGVSNPVTAVLLNFRSYDTLLEVGVLLLALIATWSVAEPAQAMPRTDNTTLQSLARLFVPAMVLAAGYILWVGAYAPGGAFQAGAILAAALVLMYLAGMPLVQALIFHRGLLALGLAVFLAAAMAPLALGGRMLEYPEGADKTFIMSIEAAATVSIGLTLTALFAGGGPARARPAH